MLLGMLVLGAVLLAVVVVALLRTMRRRADVSDVPIPPGSGVAAERAEPPVGANSGMHFTF